MNEILDGNLFDDNYVDYNLNIDQFLNEPLLAQLETDIITNDKFCDEIFTPSLLDINLNISVNNKHVNNNHQICPFTNTNSGLTPPDTPPNSERSSPPMVNDVLSSKTQFSLNQNVCPLASNSADNELKMTTVLSQNPVNKETFLLIPTKNYFQSSHSVKKQLFPFPPSQATNVKLNQDKLNLSELRKEARKLRNRESANNSRQKKKEYIKNLENKINTLNAENLSLKEENNLLKQRVSKIESELNQLKSNLLLKNSSTSINNKQKATLSLLALFFMIGFKFSPFTNLFIDTEDKMSFYKPKWNERFSQKDHHNGRTLLWDDSQESKLSIFNEDIYLGNSTSVSNLNNTLLNFNCNYYMNKTESMRIDQELRGWVSRLKKEKQAINNKRKSSKVMRVTRHKRLMTMARFKLSLDHGIDDFNLYNGPASYLSINYQDLLKALHPREDTFYFLSFSAGDHFLLPAEVNKTAIRPRFSIVMPALNQINSSKSGHTNNQTMSQISMMQIDCEVMNMNMLFVNNLYSSQKPQLQGNEKKKTNKKKQKKVYY